MNPLAKDRCLVLPEILSIVFSYLDHTSLIHALHVNRAWNEVALHYIWSDIRGVLPVTSFMNQVSKSGSRIRRLDLKLHLGVILINKEVNQVIVKILESTPNLQRLSVTFPPALLPRTIIQHLITIRNMAGSKLQSLGIHTVEPDDIPHLVEPITISTDEILDIFPGFTSLKSLDWGSSATDIQVRAMVYAIPTLESLTLRHHSNQLETAFGNTTAQLIGTRLPKLTRLGIINNPALTAEGMTLLSKHTERLTYLNLSLCSNIGPDGIWDILSACKELSHIHLRSTKVNNTSLIVLSAQSRASKLRELNIRNCGSLSTAGINEILMNCANLETLDFWGVPVSNTSFFNDTPWVCTRLMELSLGESILQGFQYLRMDKAIGCLYRQLGRLTRLTKLEIGAITLRLQLFELGREEIAKLTKLETLSVANDISVKDLLWITNRLSSLKVLNICMGTATSSLAQDLMEVHSGLKIAPVRMPRAPPYGRYMQGSSYSSDSDDGGAVFGLMSDPDTDEQASYMLSYHSLYNDSEEDSDDQSNSHTSVHSLIQDNNGPISAFGNDSESVGDHSGPSSSEAGYGNAHSDTDDDSDLPDHQVDSDSDSGDEVNSSVHGVSDDSEDESMKGYEHSPWGAYDSPPDSEDDSPDYKSDSSHSLEEAPSIDNPFGYYSPGYSAEDDLVNDQDNTTSDSENHGMEGSTSEDDEIDPDEGGIDDSGEDDEIGPDEDGIDGSGEEDEISPIIGGIYDSEEDEEISPDRSGFYDSEEDDDIGAATGDTYDSGEDDEIDRYDNDIGDYSDDFDSGLDDGDSSPDDYDGDDFD